MSLALLFLIALGLARVSIQLDHVKASCTATLLKGLRIPNSTIVEVDWYFFFFRSQHSMHSFIFESEAKFLDPQNTPTQYPCFFCQVDLFGLFQHLEKYSDLASQFSPHLSLLYIKLMQIHDTEHSTTADIPKLSSRKQLSRVHPKSLFYFRLARKLIENLQLREA